MQLQQQASTCATYMHVVHQSFLLRVIPMQSLQYTRCAVLDGCNCAQGLSQLKAVLVAICSNLQQQHLSPRIHCSDSCHSASFQLGVDVASERGTSAL